MIEIPGKPVPLNRPRFGKGGRVYDTQREIKQKVISYINLHKPKEPIKGPVMVWWVFDFAMPKGWSTKKKKEMDGKPHTSRPDVSNLIKFYEDCMNGIIYVDDSQIFSGSFTKRYGYDAKTLISIEPLKTAT